MNDSDLAELRSIFKVLNEKAKESNIILEWVEIGGRIFFLPRLQLKP